MIFAEHETLEQINEKARLHGLSYGKYVLARYNGQFADDALTRIELKHEHRLAYCKVRKRAR